MTNSPNDCKPVIDDAMIPDPMTEIARGWATPAGAGGYRRKRFDTAAFLAGMNRLMDSGAQAFVRIDGGDVRLPMPRELLDEFGIASGATVTDDTVARLRKVRSERAAAELDALLAKSALLHSTPQHPELRPGEVVLGNLSPEQVTGRHWKTLRAGDVPYAADGKPLSADQAALVRPYFVMAAELRAFGLHVTDEGRIQYTESILIEL